MIRNLKENERNLAASAENFRFQALTSKGSESKPSKRGKNLSQVSETKRHGTGILLRILFSHFTLFDSSLGTYIVCGCVHFYLKDDESYSGKGEREGEWKKVLSSVSFCVIFLLLGKFIM